MRKSDQEEKLRTAVVRLLNIKGYSVEDISKGSGVPKLSRLEVMKGEEKLTCVVKTTTSGRISFTREDDGTYKVLKDVDGVIHAHPKSTTEVNVTFFDRTTVQKAFEKNWNALQEDGKEHLPIWVNPEWEEGRRLTGSGFMDEAVWTETLSLSQEDESEYPSTTPDGTAGGGIMDHIKKMLSEHMGVRPDQLEIDVRVRL